MVRKKSFLSCFGYEFSLAHSDLRSMPSQSVGYFPEQADEVVPLIRIQQAEKVLRLFAVIGLVFLVHPLAFFGHLDRKRPHVPVIDHAPDEAQLFQLADDAAERGLGNLEDIPDLLQDVVRVLIRDPNQMHVDKGKGLQVLGLGVRPVEYDREQDLMEGPVDGFDLLLEIFLCHVVFSLVVL